MRLRLLEHIIYGLLRFVKAIDKREPLSVELGTHKIQRILLVSCTAIGDTLMSTPAFRSMRLAYPHAQIDLLIHPAYLKLFQHDPHIDQFIPYNGRWKGFLRLLYRLRQQRYEVVAILHGNEPQATPLAYLSGARWIFKLPNTNRFGFLLTNAFPRLSGSDFAHGIIQRLAVAKLAGGADTDEQLHLTIDPTADKAAMEYLQQQGYQGEIIIGFQVGASTNSRRWAPLRYAELAKRLLQQYPHVRILITGSPQERILARSIAQEINDARIMLNAGQVALYVLPALIAQCTVLITPDTGIMHMAIAIKTPIVGLFAAADWHSSGPRQNLDRHRIIQKSRTCTPCLGKRCTYQQPLCMDQITVEEVEEAVKWILIRSQENKYD